MRALLFVLLAAQAPLLWAEQSNPDASQWLRKIYSATRKLSYSGTFVFQQGQQVETSRIAHMVDQAGTHERLETLDGTPREIIRHNDEVKCYLPATMTLKIDRQAAQKPFPVILPEQLKDLTDYYTIRKGGVERIAGYDCQAILLEPKDKMRYGHKLWADLNTGMLLKAKTFNEANEVVEQFTFTQLRIGGVDREQIRSRFSGKGRDWRVEDSGMEEANLSQAGWTVKAQPPGFRKVTEMKRSLGGAQGVGHIVLSDGLAAVSVFIAPQGAKPASVPPGLSRQGAINVYTRQVGEHLVTVVGEAPAESVKSIANAVEYHKPGN